MFLLVYKFYVGCIKKKAINVFKKFRTIVVIYIIDINIKNIQYSYLQYIDILLALAWCVTALDHSINIVVYTVSKTTNILNFKLQI